MLKVVGLSIKKIKGNAMGGVLKKNTSSQSPPFIHKQKDKNLYRLVMMVKNKKGSLAKVSLMLADRGAGIETLDFKPSSKAGLAELNLTISVDKSQLQGVLNDAQRMSEIKSASMLSEPA